MRDVRTGKTMSAKTTSAKNTPFQGRLSLANCAMQLWEDGVIFSEDYTIDEEKRFLYSLVELMGQASAEG